jgi:hypothetical protein
MAKQAQIDAVRPLLTELDHGVTAAEHAIETVVSGADKATEVIEHGLEKVADVVPEAFDKTVHVAADVTRTGVRALRNPKTVVVGIALAGAAAGVALGVVAYRLQKKRLERQYEEKFEKELDEMREFYLRRSKKGDFATPEGAAERLLVRDAVVALDSYKNGKGEKTEENPIAQDLEKIATETTEVPAQKSGNTNVRYDKVIPATEAAKQIQENVVTLEDTTRNVFVDGKQLVPDEWDQEAEEARRDEGRPYVISYEEYMENSFQHEQTTMTYFSGDDVLADAAEDAVPDVEAVVGTENLARFGQGSKSPNTVYVRNEVTETDYEVTLSQGSFAEEVMGLRHSDDVPRLRRPRWGDHE